MDCAGIMYSWCKKGLADGNRDGALTWWSSRQLKVRAGRGGTGEGLADGNRDGSRRASEPMTWAGWPQIWWEEKDGEEEEKASRESYLATQPAWDLRFCI